jgi:hypothetical protein
MTEGRRDRHSQFDIRHSRRASNARLETGGVSWYVSVMRRTLAVLALLAAGGCSARPTHPFLPPEAMYTSGSTLLAAGGVMAGGTGAYLLDSSFGDRSASQKRWGTGLAAAGGAMTLAAAFEAIAVEDARARAIARLRAISDILNGTPRLDAPAPPDPPSLPEIPWTFEERSPLDGEPPP